jgi:hypothetical protein
MKHLTKEKKLSKILFIDNFLEQIDNIKESILKFVPAKYIYNYSALMLMEIQRKKAI